MSFKSKFLMIVMSASLAMYSIAGAWLATRAQQPANDPDSQRRIFESVLQHIQNDYVDEPNMEKVRAGALRGLAYGLDPYSTYLTPEQVKDYRSGDKNNLVGIGAELSMAASFLYVVAPIKARLQINQAYVPVTSSNTSTAKPPATFRSTTRGSYSTARRELKSSCAFCAPASGP